MTLTEVQPGVSFNPLRDKSYQHTRLGRDVADFLAWKKLGGAAERTLDQYERDLARGCLMYPELPLGDWTDAEILHVATQFKTAERRVRVAAWRSFFKWARQTKRITENPMETVPTIRQPARKFIDTFNEAEVESFLALPLRDGVLMQLLFDTGVRKNEASNLRLRDFRPESTLDAPNGKLIVLNGKGGKDRVIPATEVLARRLNELALLDGLNSDDYLWYTTHKNMHAVTIRRSVPIKATSFHKWWERQVKTSRVKYRNLHTTRHTCALRYLRGGGRLERLSKMLGHSSVSITADLYGHLTTQDISEDLAIIEANRG